ncbi:MAG: hypothetical protein WDW36_001242 [Sanguina aurantia]
MGGACSKPKVPIAQIAVLDGEDAHHLGVLGPPGCTAPPHTPQKYSFCQWLLSPDQFEVVVIEDLLVDRRFNSNPVVTGSPHFRAYMGCPLISNEGFRIGSICAIDVVPRKWDQNSANMLSNMAELAVREIERDALLQQMSTHSSAMTSVSSSLVRAVETCGSGRERVRVSASVRRVRARVAGLFIRPSRFSLHEHPMLPSAAAAVACHAVSSASICQANCYGRGEGVMCVDMSRQVPGLVLHANDAFFSTTSHTKDLSLMGGSTSIWHFFKVTSGDPEALWAEACRAAEGKEPFTLSLTTVGTTAPVQVCAQFRAATRGNMHEQTPNISMPVFLPEALDDPSVLYYFVSLKAAACSNRTSFTHTSVTPFDKCKLGVVIGTGQHSRVHRGVWDGAVVALKVYTHTGPPGPESQAAVSHRLPSATPSASSSSTAPASATSIPTILDTHATLRHPCIVKIYLHATRQVPESDPPAWETWVLSELCNRGSLSEVVTRGLCSNLGQPSHTEGPSDDDPSSPHLPTILAIAKGRASAPRSESSTS